MTQHGEEVRIPGLRLNFDQVLRQFRVTHMAGCVDTLIDFNLTGQTMSAFDAELVGGRTKGGGNVQ